MRKFQLFFKQVVAKIEDYTLPLKRYLLLFIAILSLRLCLEFFANNRLFQSDDVMHIGLWFLFIVQAFMLQLHLFSKVKVEQIVKLVICCFSIALTAPIIDLIVSQGKFSKMNYLSVNSFSDIAWSYITIGGASLSRGATLGIRTEIVLLVIASFNYVYLKTGNIWRSLAGTFSIYTVLFLSGAIPYFLGKINTAFNLTYGQNDQSSSYLLFTLDIGLFLFLAYRYNRKMISFKFDFPIVFRIFGSIGLVVLGAYLARKAYPDNWMLDPTTLYYFPLLAVVLLMLYTYEGYGKQQLKNEGTNFTVQNGLLLVLVCTSACISFHTLFAVLFTWGMLFFLYEKPLRFINISYLSPLLQAGLMLGYLLIGFMAFGAPMVGMEISVIFLTLIVSFLIYLVMFYINRYIYKK
ncbi:MAG: hypothetical protein A3D31_18980 [Candidatus Fluviicola riflensis]|nr:MAG: hypothetical protein CHH17_05700 [Candidatus Fluviicola riflensis]OGS75872.1 MAG: hypothetical protein A3D31_18980 [Candidatus Fluviicola riflensis]OGS83552.1 MAG: hypothetical protein A2724_18995 [Fluviicola sp. RIFCSPHIGHO2_01_FULL_43_53]OGS85691.1 MAG: hypothetical protein A3E30_18525 [Fluviicola sp. RIFCSPHIGHO2_12_FULL_43_24]